MKPRVRIWFGRPEETEGYTPELDEVRDDVINAIRTAQARELAKRAAKEIAEKANSGATLDSLIDEDKKQNLKKDIAPFSWLNMVGISGISMGNVPELDSVGEDFMKSVFADLEQDHVVATNLPGRVVYVVKRVDLQPATSDLRAIFKQPTERMIATFMTDGSQSKVQQGFFDAIDKQTRFNFAEPEE